MSASRSLTRSAGFSSQGRCVTCFPSRPLFPSPADVSGTTDQLEAHDQIYDGDDGIDYAFMGSDPNAADNQCLRAAYENQVGVIYFLGIAPGRYQAIWPVYIAGWDAKALKARVVFGARDQKNPLLPKTRSRGPFCPSRGQSATTPGFVPRKCVFQTKPVSVQLQGFTPRNGEYYLCTDNCARVTSVRPMA